MLDQDALYTVDDRTFAMSKSRDGRYRLSMDGIKAGDSVWSREREERPKTTGYQYMVGSTGRDGAA